MIQRADLPEPIFRRKRTRPLVQGYLEAAEIVPQSTTALSFLTFPQSLSLLTVAGFCLTLYVSTEIYERSCEKNPTKWLCNGSLVDPEWEQLEPLKGPNSLSCTPHLTRTRNVVLPFYG